MADLASRYPTTPSFQSVNFKVNTPTQITNTMSGKIRRVGMGVSFYSWEVQYPNLIPLDAGTVKGFLAQALGPQFSFEIILPVESYSSLPAGTQTTATPRTSAAVSQGATSCTLSNATANSFILAAGDYFKFNNHSKVYQCVAPCQANGSGVATLFFSGPLVTAVPYATNLTVTAVPFTAILAAQEQEFSIGLGGITQMSVPMRETW